MDAATGSSSATTTAADAWRTVIEVGCWAHARRKFVDAERTSPREAHEVVARIKQLYAIEHQAKEFDAAARLTLRQEKAVPLLAALKGWLDQLPTLLSIPPAK